jgi:transposase
MRTYSSDLRERVARACDAGHLSRIEIATHFGVSTAWVRRLRQRRRETGSIAPLLHKRRGPGLLVERDPTLTRDLERLLTVETAGDPMSDAKWVRSSPAKLSDQLRVLGHQVGESTVYRLLKGMGFSLRANKKRRGGSEHPNRDEQFRYIASRRESFAASGLPIISVDTKKKELIGNFRNPGRVWCRDPAEVNEHDFTETAEARAVPFGIYDVVRNREQKKEQKRGRNSFPRSRAEKSRKGDATHFREGAVP